MKYLAVLRHAKSRWDEQGLADFNRPLNDRGWKASRRLGRELRDRKFQFDLVLASPAARVRETIDGVQQKFDFDAPIRFDERLYLASHELLLTIVRDLPETVHRPLLVGHNPGLQQLILTLCEADEDGMRDHVAHKLPTGAIAAMQLPAHRWNSITPGKGRMVELIRPKDLH